MSQVGVARLAERKLDLDLTIGGMTFPANAFDMELLQGQGVLADEIVSMEARYAQR